MAEDKLIKEAEEIMRRASWMHTYTLAGKVPVPSYDILKWDRWFEKMDRHVALTETRNGTVSTVFLAIDHNWFGKGTPLLFETMVFGGIFDGDTERYSTWAEAEEGHVRKVRYVTELR